MSSSQFPTRQDTVLPRTAMLAWICTDHPGLLSEREYERHL